MPFIQKEFLCKERRHSEAFCLICALSSLDDIAGEYANFVVKASEKKAGFSQSASKKVLANQQSAFP